jgi:hypothetical protein
LQYCEAVEGKDCVGNDVYRYYQYIEDRYDEGLELGPTPCYYEQEGYPCPDGDLMGAGWDEGFDTAGGYDHLKKHLSCEVTCLLGKGGTCEPGSTEPTKCCRSGRCEPFVFKVNDVERIEYRCQ